MHLELGVVCHKLKLGGLLILHYKDFRIISIGFVKTYIDISLLTKICYVKTENMALYYILSLDGFSWNFMFPFSLHWICVIFTFCLLWEPQGETWYDLIKSMFFLGCFYRQWTVVYSFIYLLGTKIVSFPFFLVAVDVTFFTLELWWGT